MKTVICWVCCKSIPAALKNAHHAKPRAAGGGPEDLVDLCSGCHHSLHRIEEMLSGPKAGEAESTCRYYYGKDVDAASRCLELAAKAAKHFSEAETLKNVKDHEDVDFALRIPQAVKRALSVLGREVRDPKSGRRLGMAGAGRQLLINAVLDRYPALRETLRESVEAAKGQPPSPAQFPRPRRKPPWDVDKKKK